MRLFKLVFVSVLKLTQSLSAQGLFLLPTSYSLWEHPKCVNLFLSQVKMIQDLDMIEPQRAQRTQR